MINLKKAFAIGLSTMALATCMVGGTMSANAAAASLTLGTTYATLTNNTNQNRYGVVVFTIRNRKTGAYVKQASAEKTLSKNGGYVSAIKTGYSSKTTYRHQASGSIYNGTNAQSGGYYTVTGAD